MKYIVVVLIALSPHYSFMDGEYVQDFIGVDLNHHAKIVKILVDEDWTSNDTIMIDAAKWNQYKDTVVTVKH